MTAKPRLSLRTRLVGLVLLGQLLPLASGLAIFAAVDVRAIRREILRQNVLEATIVAEYSAADIAFEDRKQSAATLAALARLEHIVYVAAYDAKGRLFSIADRANERRDSIPSTIAAQPEASVGISGDYIDVMQPVVQEGVRYGTIALRASTAPLAARTRAYLWSVLVAGLCVIAASIVFAIVLQRLISRPILSLAQVARKIAEQGDYSVRAKKVSGDELGFLASAFNVMLAEIERRQREAVDAIRMRDEFLSIASHELRTPLTSFRLTMDRLKRAVRALSSADVDVDVMRNYLLVVERQMQRLESLSEKLLDVTRIRAGSLLLEPEPFDLCALVRDVVDRFGDQLARAGCEVHLCACSSIVGTWDRLRIDQVVTNILSNSIKYAAGRPIDVTVEESVDKGRVIVSDHGMGVSDEAKKRIFERFERAVSPIHYAGLGLGLYISHQIVVAHGGTLTVSDTPGGGATFTMNLPK